MNDSSAVQNEDLYGTMATINDVNSFTIEGTGRQTLLACYTGAHIKDINYISLKVKCNYSTSDDNSDNQSSILFNKLNIDPIAQYKRNWGISTMCRLLGGGKIALASGNGTASSGCENPYTTPVPASVTGTLNWNTSPLVGGQSSPNAVFSGSWQQRQQSSRTSSNNTNQTSNIGNKGTSSNPELSSGNSTRSTLQATNQQNTTSWARSTEKNLPVLSVPQVTGNSSSTTTTASTGSGAVFNIQSSYSSPTNGKNEGVNFLTERLKPINTMHEALYYAQDGWGSQYVNQGSQWDVPHSPKLKTKDRPLTILTGEPGWSKVHNGTDLWEAALQNGGKPPIQTPVQNTPITSWGHTPSSNSTWGEVDDVSSVSGTDANTGNWGINPTTTINNHQGQGQPPPQEPVRPLKKDLGPKSQSFNSGNTALNDLNRLLGSIDQSSHLRDNGIVDHRGIGSDTRGGISGCLDGTLSGSGAVTVPIWSGPPLHYIRHVKPPPVGPPPSVIATLGAKLGQGPVPVMNQWSEPPPFKYVNPMSNNNKGNRWEEPSPTDHGSNLLNYDNAISLSGNTHTRSRGGLLNTQHNMSKHLGKTYTAAAVGWNNNSSGYMGNQCPPGICPNITSMPPTSKMVNQQQLWPENPRHGTWGDVGQGSHIDLNAVGPRCDSKMILSENAGGSGPNSDWGPGPKSKNSLGDCSNNDIHQSSSGQKSIEQKNQNKDYIWQSKSHIILAEMGVKEEDVEAVTRSYNICKEEALELLMSTRGLGGGGLNSWNSHSGRGQHKDDQYSFDQSNVKQQQIPFAVPSIRNTSNQQQVMFQKILVEHQPPSQQNTMQQQYSQCGGSRQMQFQPTTQQLKLVEQIQMAVQAGYLNNQILNQPLAPQTLCMLNQLLQQIEILQQNVQAVANNAKYSPVTMTASIAINKAHQQIASLQNQIAYNQAMYMKAQDHKNKLKFSSLSGLIFFKNDPLPLLESGFSDLAMNRDSQTSGQGFQTSQQSRLDQWKLPNLDQGDLGMGNDFSRAPGADSNPPLGNTSTLNSLLSQEDGSWTYIGKRSNSGWPDNAENIKEIWSNNGSNSQSESMSSVFTADHVPAFEPGNPYKGYQTKNIEDDTPGSVVHSPLSLAATMKESNNSDLFNIGGESSPTNSESTVDSQSTPLFFTSPIWRYSPPFSSTQSSGLSSQLGKLNGPKNNWANSDSGNNLQDGVLGSSGKSREPPNGLTGGSAKTENAPINLLWQSSSNKVASTWLLLRNLTKQIDGSTLKTLCIQHGSLLNFHTYLNHRMALAKYSTREEASKALRALNNCVFGNTTIFAESPTDDYVQMLLTYLIDDDGNTNGINSVQPQQQQQQQEPILNNGCNQNIGNSQGQQGSDI